MPVLSFAAANALVLLTSTVTVSALSLDDVLDKALAFVTVSLAQIILSVVLAGVLLGRLSAGAILAVNAGILATVVALETSRIGYALPTRQDVGQVNLSRVFSSTGADWWLRLLGLLAVVELGWRLIIAYALPPLGFDALWYHLTTVAGWLQTGKIALSPFSLWSSVYPENGEVFFAWSAVFLGSDTLVNTVQLGFAVVGAAAVMGIGRCVGLKDNAAAAAGLLFFLAPVVLSESTVAYVDLIFIASFLTGFYFVLRFLQPGAAVGGDRAGRRDVRFAALGGGAAGIALGTKSLGILYCGILLGLLLAHLAAAAVTGRSPFRAAAATASAFVGPLLALGGFWYARTWLAFGNPVYPIRVGFLGTTLFPGRPLEDFQSLPDHVGPWWVEVLAQWYHDLLWSGHRYYPFDARPGGFGPLWSYLAAPALAVFTFVMIRRRPSTVLNFLLPVALAFLIQPYKWWSRFTLVLLAAGVIGLAYCIDHAPVRLSAAAKAATAVLVVAGLWLCSVKVNQTITAGRILYLLTLPKAERTIGKVAHPAFVWVDRIEPHARIGVDVSTTSVGSAPRVLFFYPLFGPHFEHRVYPLAGTSASQFRTDLAAYRLDYVTVGRAGPVASLASEAAKAGCLQELPLSHESHARTYRVTVQCTESRRR